MSRRRRQSLLGMDHFVDGKLFDVRLGHLDAGCRHAFGEPLRELIEVLARFPEVDDSPTTVHGPGRVVEEPLRRSALGVDLVVPFVELLLGDPGELDADAYWHMPY